MPGQVVVVASVMVIGVDRRSNRVDERDVMGLLRQQRQMLTHPHAGGGGLDWLKRPAILQRCFRL